MYPGVTTMRMKTWTRRNGAENHLDYADCTTVCELIVVWYKLLSLHGVAAEDADMTRNPRCELNIRFFKMTRR